MKRLILALAAALTAFPAHAIDKIYSPYVDAGEWELEYFGHRSNDSDRSKDNAQTHEFSVEHGVNDWWQTELYGIWSKDAGENVDFEAVEWENIFQFTEKGEYWLDTGATLAYEWTPESSEPDTIEARFLVAKDIGETSHVFNLLLEKEVGSGPKESLEAGLFWSSRYNLNPYFQPGFEIQSELGKVSDAGEFDTQEHYIGPVAYGTIPFEMEGNKIEGLQYRAGYLFGFSNGASTGQAVLQLEYELEF